MLPLPWWGSYLTLEPSGLHITISGLLWAPFPTHLPFPLHPTPSACWFLFPFVLLPVTSSSPHLLITPHCPHPTQASTPLSFTWKLMPVSIHAQEAGVQLKTREANSFFQLLMSSHAFQEIVLYFTFLLCYTLYVLHYLCNQNITLLTRS